MTSRIPMTIITTLIALSCQISPSCKANHTRNEGIPMTKTVVIKNLSSSINDKAINLSVVNGWATAILLLFLIASQDCSYGLLEANSSVTDAMFPYVYRNVQIVTNIPIRTRSMMTSIFPNIPR